MKIKLLLGLLFLGGTLWVGAADAPPGIALTDTPAVVQKTIKAQVGKGKITSIDKLTDEDGVTYAVDMTAKDGSSKVFTVAADGTLASTEIALADTPAAIQATIKTQLGQNTLVGIDKIISDYEITYAVEMTTKGGQDRNFTVDMDGNLESLEVAPSDLPENVQNTIKSQLGLSKLESIDETFDNSIPAYEVEMTTRAGLTRSFTVGETGKLEDVEIGLSDAPDAIQAAIKSQVGAGKLQTIDKNFTNNATAFDVEMTTKDGQDRSFTLASNGSLVSLEMGLSETPKEVQAAIAKEAPQGRIVSIDKTYAADGTNFDVTVVSSGGRGKERDFLVAPGGNLLTRQVFIESIAAAARKTIEDQIGSGKIIRIDRSFPSGDSQAGFAVQGRKNGQPFNFSVGVQGKFLGMDD